MPYSGGECHIREGVLPYSGGVCSCAPRLACACACALTQPQGACVHAAQHACARALSLPQGACVRAARCRACALSHGDTARARTAAAAEGGDEGVRGRYGGGKPRSASSARRRPPRAPPLKKTAWAGQWSRAAPPTPRVPIRRRRKEVPPFTGLASPSRAPRAPVRGQSRRRRRRAAAAAAVASHQPLSFRGATHAHVDRRPRHVRVARRHCVQLVARALHPCAPANARVRRVVP